MSAKIDDEKLKSILSEVTTELDSMMKSEMARLSKARPGESTTGEGEEDTSKTDPTGDNTSASDPAPAASATADASGSDSASPAADASAAAPGDDGSAPPPAADDGSAPVDPSADPSADPAAQAGPIDPQALVAEYSKLPPEDLKMHYMACKEALVQVLGAAGGDDGSAPPPDASAAAGAPPPPAASAPPPPAGPPGSAPTLKAEIGMKDNPKANGENPLHKSEDVANLEKHVAILTAAVKHVMEAPLRKSITSVADLPGSGKPDVSNLSKTEIKAKLKNLDFGKLSKNDRDLVSGYDLGTVKADQVAHLLK